MFMVNLCRMPWPLGGSIGEPILFYYYYYFYALIKNMHALATISVFPKLYIYRRDDFENLNKKLQCYVLEV